MEHELNETYKNNLRTEILDNMHENCTINLFIHLPISQCVDLFGLTNPRHKNSTK